MRYHYDPPDFYLSLHGLTYICNHPVYSSCTLYLIDDIGLAVIQQRYDSNTKRTWWGEIDRCLIDDLYLNPGFLNYFNSKAGRPQNDIYPTVTVRQIMWALKMKPLKREPWETVFDKCPI